MRKMLGGFGAAAVGGLLLAGCVSQAATAPLLDEGDLVYSGIGPAQASNIDRFDAFLAVTESGGDDAVRIVSMTVEGDPIYTDIAYAEGKYTVYLDMSEDAYASKEDRMRKKAAECTQLEQSSRPSGFSEYACGAYSFVVKDL